jgi:2-phospho-L-lactate guanylyltransferase
MSHTDDPAPVATTPSGTVAWAAVVPVKPFARAKTRLASLGDQARLDLVAAFAQDTVEALSECPRVGLVVVVTDELALSRALAGTGVVAVPEGHGDDLNATLVQGAAEAVRRRPELRPLAVCADLPALTPAAMEDFLAGVVAVGSEWFVADVAGTGTTTYLASTLDAFAPRFGPGSADAHRSSGAEELSPLAPAVLRRDVDTPEDLARAVELGVGERTRWAVTRHRL